MDFDLQRFLTDMKHEISQDIRSIKTEIKEDVERLESKVDTCLLTLADHETRVTVMEQTPPGEHEARLIRVEGFVKNTRWFMGTAIAAGVAASISWFTSFFTGSSK